ncbi:MAG: YHS domain-containing protein [Acidiferrobacterales bacterium]
MPTDPVCGMVVEEKRAAAKAEYQGMAYYFCSSGCHKAFTADPEKFAGGTRQSGESGHGVKRR